MEETQKNFFAPEPEVGAVYSYGWEILKTNFWALLGIVVVGVILGAAPTALSGGNPMKDHNAFSSLFWILVSGPVSYGIIWTFLKAVRKEDFEIKDMFAAFGPNYWNVLVANLLVTVVVGLGFVLLIVPGIYLACKLAFVPFLITDKGMKFSDAFSASWDLTKGHGWTIFLMGLLAIPIVIGGLILLGVGILVAMIWIHAAFAALYYTVDSNRPKTIEV
ncbi:MAG: hypothetical protein JXR71_08505 [Bacteroidales bacterium]|nr:hypothetical protein [Bacteroidales bacterium]